MAEEQWLLKEDGYLNVDTLSVKNIIYHPNLNIILVLTNDGFIKILDVNSGVILQSCFVSAKVIQGRYLPEQDKVLFWDGFNIGLRGDYNGVLLLDTILQRAISQSDDIVKIEILLSEAVLFLQSLQNLEEHGLENTTDVSNELIAKITEAKANTKKGIKAQKWSTICLELPHSSLKMVASSMVIKLKRLDRHIPALAIASAINERLTDLLSGARIVDSVKSGNTQRFNMFSEAARRQTFEQWPHMDYKWALPDQMAQAGFYHQPSETGDDRAMCFTCSVCLVSWEKTDEPWSEHERHSPTCPFVKGEYTQNVPLSITYATNPAIGSTGFDIISSGDQEHIICTASYSGEIAVWNVERQLQICHTFTLFREILLYKPNFTKYMEKPQNEMKLSSMCTYQLLNNPTDSVQKTNMSLNINPQSGIASINESFINSYKSKLLGTKIVCGVNFTIKAVDQSFMCDKTEMSNINVENCFKDNNLSIDKTNSRKLYLVIFDLYDSVENNPIIQQSKDIESVETTHYNSVSFKNDDKKIKKPSLHNIFAEEKDDDVYMKVFSPHVNFKLHNYWKNCENDKNSMYKFPDFDNEESKMDDFDFTDLINASQQLDQHSQESDQPQNTTKKSEITTNQSNYINNQSISNNKTNSIDLYKIKTRIVQYISISTLMTDYFEISEIISTYDKKYLLVLLKTISKDNVCDSKMDIDEDDNIINNFNTEDVKHAQLILYKIQENGLLEENPQCLKTLHEEDIPINICMLPNCDTNGRRLGIDEQNNSVFAMTCNNGTLKLLAINSLKTIAEANIDGEKFVSVTYCKSLERLCGCTEKGSLHFYSFYDLDVDSDERDEDNVCFISSENIPNCNDVNISAPDDKNNILSNSAPLDNTLLDSSQCGLNNDPSSHNSSILANKTDLTINDLKLLYSLTLFDEMLTSYSAEVPGCWNELVQAQKQRRHPQHLRPGDDIHLTKTWRLHNDATTWDEHIIELTLPKSASLGHIDFKFSLYQQCSNPPAIQVTLLKQNSSGLGYRIKSQKCDKPNSSSVDENVDFNLSSNDNKENPVLSEEYLQAHNAEIICGPVELSSCIDINDDGGLVVLTSPKLFRTKGRNFLLHIKTMADPSKDGQGKTRVPVRKKGISRFLFPSFTNLSTQNATNERVTFFQEQASNKSRKNDFYIGCDWLHEISITIRSTRHTPKVSNERMQRSAMLESNIFLDNLIKIVCNNDELLQSIALDILIWIVSIRMARYRTPSHEIHKLNVQKTNNDKTKSSQTFFHQNNDNHNFDMKLQQIECVKIIQNSLNELIRMCIIYGNRTVAHKCVKLVILTSDGVQNMPLDRTLTQNFEDALKNSILQSLKEIINSKYAGAMRWFMLLISGTSTIETQNLISEACVQLLLDTAKEMENRKNPYNSLLKTRFGLYGMPFESELFDIDSPLASNSNSLPQTFASIVKNATAPLQSNQSIDLKNFFMTDGSDTRILPFHLRRRGVGNFLKGLLEVEPLHFVCCGASEATRLENMDVISANQASNIVEDIIFDAPSQNTVDQVHNEIKNSDKENNEDDVMNNVKNILVDKIFYSALKKHKTIKEEIKKLVKNDNLESEDISFGNNDSVSDCLYSKDPDLKFISLELISSQEKTQIKEDISVKSINNKIQEFLSENSYDDNTPLPWHKILNAPPKQMIVIDRMHSGARRYVILDFGSPVLLTDLIIPACDDLLTLYIDIWCFDEETDSIRLVVTSDIASKSLVLSDIQPPPIFRYMKITSTGRYGLSATRCKIPIGSFYGHVLVLDKDAYADPVLKYVRKNNINYSIQLKSLYSLFEDVHCRYNLSSNKLQDLLEPILTNEISNIAHMQMYLNKNKESEEISSDNAKIISIYEECILLQHQLNVIKNVIQRLESVNRITVPPKLTEPKEMNLTLLCSDKLKVISECLTEILLHFIVEYGMKNISSLYYFFNQETCNVLFNTLVISGDSHMQLAICSILVRMCCFQPWWGEFLANTFLTFYSSQNSKIFPQDRVFFLLTYLGRRSIAMGTCRSIVIDAILKTLAKLLAPLSPRYQTDNMESENEDYQNTFLWSSTDLQLIGWILLFLSVCLDDGCDKKDQGAIRWDFMSGDSDLTKSRTQSSNNGSKPFSRSFKKRYLPNKQYSSNNLAEKFYLMQSEQSIPECIMELNNKAKPIKTIPNIQRSPHNHPKSNDGSSSDSDPPFDKGLKSIKPINTLVVIRGLVGLILGMDFTCNTDLFLLTCKVIARLVTASRPSIQLSKIMTIAQLQQIVRLAVWEDQQQPWAIHAITCLLQDILEADKNYKIQTQNSESNSEGFSSSTDIDDMSINSDSNVFSDQMISETLRNAEQVPVINFTESKHLPSLMECEDTEFDEFVDILERGKNLIKKEPNIPNRSGSITVTYRNVSSAMDSRLEYGLDSNVEITLRRLTMMSSLNLFASLPQISVNESLNKTPFLTPWPDAIVQAWSGSEYNQGMATNLILMLVFDNIFTDLLLQEPWLNLEHALQLWLTLNGELTDKVSADTVFNSGDTPKIPLGPNAVHGLISALTWHPGIKLQSWCLGFQCLTLACNPHFSVDSYSNDNSEDFNENYTRRMGVFIVNNPNFEKMLLRFFSGLDMCSSNLEANRCVGPTVCKLLNELFVWIEKKSDVTDVCYVKKKLKEILLRVVLHLVQPGGAISNQKGPIDAQNLLIEVLIVLQYEKTDLGVAMSIIESVSYLIYNNISNIGKIYLPKSSDGCTQNVFGSLFATVLGPTENTRQSKTVSDSTLIVTLLKLSTILVQIPLPRRGEEYKPVIDNAEELNESQTDEIKAEQQNNENKLKGPCVADTVLQHYPTMTRLLGALSRCTNSSFAMVFVSSLYSLNNSVDGTKALNEPQSIGDAIFQLLILLNKKSSQPVLMIKPLYDYLSTSSDLRQALPRLQLSEPFLWFILNVLEYQSTVSIFTEMGGIRVLCQSLVRCNRTLINTQPSLVSMIMQYLTKSPKLQNNNSNISNLKKSSWSMKCTEGLINFGPFCTITSINPTAQPADVLIQAPVASHRRARTAAWTYLFYPNESYVDLTVTLPTAVLLREIQIQPHLNTLATCPSAVAIEITRDNTLGAIPLSQPMSTVGMTSIRLKFAKPEIATSIVIRLYRPRDSSNIGLSTIYILGTTIFNESCGSSSKTQNSLGLNDGLNDDDVLSKTCLGWLRILAQCFSVATFNGDSQISNMVIKSAAEVPGFLESCCLLLNVAPINPSTAIQNLETILLKLGLHNYELGLKVINNLLKNSIPQTFKLCNDAVSDLLYDLCTTEDNFTRARISAMLNWMKSLKSIWNQQENIVVASNPYSGFIKCLASILWSVYSTNVIPDLPEMINNELFEIIFEWTVLLDDKEPFKKAVDSMLCSICCIKPEMFTILLQKMNILVPNLSRDKFASISDDRKDTEALTDDTKQEDSDTSEWYSHLVIQDISNLYLTKSQLQTIAMACQSPLAIYQLLDSGLPSLLISILLEFCYIHSKIDKDEIKIENKCSNKTYSCLTDSDKAENYFNRIVNNKNSNYPMVNEETVTQILDFFSEICSEGHMRDWLGSYEGSVFWKPLLDLLCNNKPLKSDGELTSNFVQLEGIMIRFLSKVTSCHPKNQETLTLNLISVIKKKDTLNSINDTTILTLNNKTSISGFTRRLVLQLLLESEKILVSIRSDTPLVRKELNAIKNNHPSKRPNAHHLLFFVSTHTKCQEILENCISHLSPESHSPDLLSTVTSTDSRKELMEMSFGMGFGLEFLSVAAGVTAKDKRIKEAKNQAALKKRKDFYSMIKVKDNTISTTQISDYTLLSHPSCPGVILTCDTTISQILTMLQSSGNSLSTPCITLHLAQTKRQIDEISDDQEIRASDFEPILSPLQIFSSRGGLSLLAHYLPTIYQETSKTQSPAPEKEKTPPVNEWVKVEPNDDIYEDLDTLTESSSKLSAISSVPQHSLVAFGLFLKLPAYSDVLLRDKLKAQCLLRLVLGVTGDGEGNEIYNLSLASSLPTLPFEVFRQLLESSPLTTDDGLFLRRMVIEVGAIHLVLNCLGIFTHHSQTSQINGQAEMPTTNIKSTPNATEEQIISDDKSHVYWAKGTGFGTGSTQQSWNVEQALLRQKNEEEHVTILLQVLSSYINPGDHTISNIDPLNSFYDVNNDVSSELPSIFFVLLQQSCLISALSSYLRNDSVLDITRHIPLYRSILQLLRAIGTSNQLFSLLLPQRKEDSNNSIVFLLTNMKACVDTYASRLKVNKKSNMKGQTQKVTVSIDDGDDEGLALLIPDIQETTFLVQNATNSDTISTQDDETMSVDKPIITRSIEDRYLEVMKGLQFATYEMLAETDDGYRFVLTYYFENNIRMNGDRGHPARVKRLAQETVTLSTSLPLSYSSSVFVRCDGDRLDIMKVLITGPADTPYANGCFEFDVYFPPDYPNSPMMINLETTGRHTVRFNPNLYNDGKVCLSVLNTWHGRPEEKWNAQTSSFLQVLVSIQSLILVPEPYFNEPGFERSRGTPTGTHNSREYNSNIYQASVRWAMIEQIKNPSPCFKEIIHTHFWLKRHEICNQIEDWINELSKPQYSERNGRTISFNLMVLRRHYRQLREELAKLPIPEGLEDLDCPFNANSPSPTASSAALYNFISSNLDEAALSTTSTITNDTSIDNHIQEKSQNVLTSAIMTQNIAQPILTSGTNTATSTPNTTSAAAILPNIHIEDILSDASDSLALAN